MKLSAQWIRDFIDLAVDDRRLAEDLTAVGIAVEGISGSGADTVFEMEIGTNRPDAMNHYGVAREAAAIYDVGLRALSGVGPRASAKPITSAAKAASVLASSGTTEVVPFPVAVPAHASFPITVEEPELCPRFSARAILGTKIKASPQKVARRLELLGHRLISNAVDATNYVLWEMGKPTHVFDMDLLEGGRLIIRHAKNGEKFKTLDGVERTLTSDDLVVADAKKPVGLAGVMGGFDTMITEKTRNILIESAWWDPAIVRHMSRRHGIHTDASHRFERGADFESTILSCDLVAELILDSGGGELAGNAVDVVSRQIDQAPVVLRVSEVRRILGDAVGANEIFRILKKLGFELIPEGQGDAQFGVQIPSWRLDVEREIDLIEEIARLHGFDKFPNTLPAYSGAVAELPHAAVDAAFRARALALGYNEALSLTFISHADAERFESFAGATSPAKAANGSAYATARLEAAPFQDNTAVPKAAPLQNHNARVLELENPLSEEASVMRTTLVPGMLDMLAWNLNRNTEDVRLFEMGRVYEMRGGERVEPMRACLGASWAAVKGSIPVGARLDLSSVGNSPPKTKEGLDGASSVRSDLGEAFRGFKGDVENLLVAFECGQLTFDRETAEYFHPERSARALMDGAPVAQFGQTHPNLTERSWEERIVRVTLRCTAGNCPGRSDDLTLSVCPICGGRFEKSEQKKQVLVPARLPENVFLAEIDMEQLQARGLRTVKFSPLAKYPAVERDFSFVFGDEVEFEAMQRAVKKLSLAELREFKPVEIFRGGAIGAGRYSILLRARLQSGEGTLRDEKIAHWAERIVAALQELGGVQRA